MNKLCIIGVTLLLLIPLASVVTADITEKWSVEIPIKWSNCQPIMHDVDDDEQMEIFFVDRNGGSGTSSSAICLNSDGTIKWTNTQLPYNVFNHKPLELYEIDGDWMLFISAPHGGYALNATNGELMWTNPEVQGMESHSLILEIDGIVYFYVSRNTGNEGGQHYYGPKLLKVNAKTGVIELETEMHYSCHGGISGGDMDGNGNYFIIVTDRNYGGGKGVRCYNARTLEMVWNRADITCSSHCAALEDINGDGYRDVVVFQQRDDNAGLYCLDGKTGYNIPGKFQDTISGLACHESYVLSDLNTGNGLKVITSCYSTIDVFDIDSWSFEETDLPFSSFPPFVANVMGDEKFEIIVTGFQTSMPTYIYDSNYNLLKTLSYSGDFAPRSGNVNDIDNDGYNELIIVVTPKSITEPSPIRIYCYDTTVKSSNYDTMTSRMNNFRTGAPLEIGGDVPSIPGFEILTLMISLGAAFILLRRKQK